MTDQPLLIKCYWDAGWKKWSESPIYVAHLIEVEEEPIENFKKIDAIAHSSCQAEYYGLIWAMQYCLRVEEKCVHFLGDNQTVVRQMQGVYRVDSKGKHPDIKRLYETAQIEWKKFKIVRITYIPREKNKADKLIKAGKKK